MTKPLCHEIKSPTLGQLDDPAPAAFSLPDTLISILFAMSVVCHVMANLFDLLTVFIGPCESWVNSPIPIMRNPRTVSLTLLVGSFK